MRRRYGCSAHPVFLSAFIPGTNGVPNAATTKRVWQYEHGANAGPAALPAAARCTDPIHDGGHARSDRLFGWPGSTPTRNAGRHAGPSFHAAADAATVHGRRTSGSCHARAATHVLRRCAAAADAATKFWPTSGTMSPFATASLLFVP